MAKKAASPEPKPRKVIENPPPITSPTIKRISAIGLKDPTKLTPKQVQSICASVDRHIEPRAKPASKSSKA